MCDRVYNCTCLYMWSGNIGNYSPTAPLILPGIHLVIASKLFFIYYEC